MCRPDDYIHEDRPYIDQLDIAPEVTDVTTKGIHTDWDLRVTSKHTKFDPVVHDAGWRARLIYEEVKYAPRGRLPLVNDRQSAEGAIDALVGRLTGEVLGDIGDAMRYLMSTYSLTPDSEGLWEMTFPDLPMLTITFGAHQSYGYIYLRVTCAKTAVPA